MNNNDDITIGNLSTVTLIGSLDNSSGGNPDYNALMNRPKVNNVTLEGNKSLSELGIQNEINIDNKLDYNLIDNVPTKTSDFINDGDGTNPFLIEHQSLENYYTKQEVNDNLSLKVDKVEGKGLSTNDYTNEEKTKLDNIDMSAKQDILVSGTNIKTINNKSILGSGNIVIEGGGGDTVVYYKPLGLSDTLPLSNQNFNKFIADLLNDYLFNKNNKEYKMISETQHGYNIDRYCAIRMLSTGIYTEIQLKIERHLDQYSGLLLYEIPYIASNVITATSVYVDTTEYENQNITQIFSDRDENKNDITYGTVLINGYNINLKDQSKVPLGINNTNPYTPTSDYHPSTKKYVDDRVLPNQTPTGTETDLDNIQIGNTLYKVNNGVYIGSTEPTNNANIWIDTSGEETPYAEGVEF